MHRLNMLAATVMIAALAGCGAAASDDSVDPDPAPDTDTDTDPDTDPDTDTDTGPRAPCTDSGDADTAPCSLFYAGDARTSNGAFVSGHFGFVLATRSLEVGCSYLSEWSETVDPAPACPQCDWAFTLTLANGTADGEACTSIGLTGDYWDGFTGSWGFANALDYDYAGTIYTLDLVVLYYSPEYGGWNPFAYNQDGRGYNVGDAEYLSFMREYGYSYAYP